MLHKFPTKAEWSSKTLLSMARKVEVQENNYTKKFFPFPSFKSSQIYTLPLVSPAHFSPTQWLIFQTQFQTIVSIQAPHFIHSHFCLDFSHLLGCSMLLPTPHHMLLPPIFKILFCVFHHHAFFHFCLPTLASFFHNSSLSNASLQFSTNGFSILSSFLLSLALSFSFSLLSFVQTMLNFVKWQGV